MAVTLTGPTGLFTVLGKIFYAIETLNTARGTTVPPEIIDVITAFEALPNTMEMQQQVEQSGLATALIAWRESSGLAASLGDLAKRLIIRMVNDDNPQRDQTLATALTELIDQMEGAGGETNPDDDVDASTSAVSVSAAAGNRTDGVIIATTTLGDGRNAEHVLAEDIEAKVASTGATANVSLAGEAAELSPLSSRWPKGSGVNTSLQFSAPAVGLLKNGGFDDEDDRADSPDDWIVEVGTVGTTIKMSNYEIQTVTISGSPTSGKYTLTYTSTDNNQQTTAPLSFDASGAAVQTALRLLAGLESVTVATTGTSPNYTHTITFTKAHPPGNLPMLTSVHNFDVGSIAHAETQAGSPHVFRDKSMEIDSDGAQLTSIKQRIGYKLSPRTAYAVCVWLKVDVFPAAGELTIELVDGAGNVVNDAQGNANAFTVDPRSGGGFSTTAFQAASGFFRTPTVLPELAYLRLRISTAVSDTTSLFIDEACFLAATSLYDGGPLAAAFAGQKSAAITDAWTLATTNDRAGKFQEWFRRCFNLPLVRLPSDTAGAETIDDALIA